MALEIVRNDISKVRADAIVNTANPMEAVGSGVDKAIYDAAGKRKLLAARKKIGEIKPGDVAETPAFKLHAKYIIHSVGAVWEGGKKGEIEVVAECYRNSLKRAKELGCESIAFPLLSSGIYMFPKSVALKTAISEISGFLCDNEMTVYLVVYDKEAFEVSGKVFDDIASLIDDNDVFEPEYGVREAGPYFERQIYGSYLPSGHSLSKESFDEPDENESEKDEYDLGNLSRKSSTSNSGIGKALRQKEETFQKYLFRLIDRKGLEDTYVYKKANIDRKHFSKIRSNENYNPSKRTAIAFAIALELNLDETKDLLKKAGFALSRSSVFDIIIEYCIENNITDIYEINCILFKYDQPTLGA